MHRKPLSVVLLLLLVAAPAAAQEAPEEPAPEQEIYPIVFPVAGENRYTDTWGAARSGGRTHRGTDILADKMVPVVAAASGTVGWMHDEQGGNCCAMALHHDDGWQSWYIHLNNDTPGTDDGIGWGFAEGIESGARVEAGQLIGWVGDSGNAEWTTPHLHFELHRPDGVAINPYPHVVAAEIGEPPPPSEEPPPPPPDPVPNELPEGDDHHPEAVLVDSDTGRWHVRDHHGEFESHAFGGSGHQPIWGDWDCDGEPTHGMYRPSDGFIYLNNRLGHDAVEIGYYLDTGVGGELVAVAGDFNGDGCDTVALYQRTAGRVFISNELGEEGAVLEPVKDYYFGIPGDKPYVGDFDGNGIDTLVVFRPSENTLYFRNSNTLGVADVEFVFGYDDWIPVA